MSDSSLTNIYKSLKKTGFIEEMPDINDVRDSLNSLVALHNIVNEILHTQPDEQIRISLKNLEFFSNEQIEQIIENKEKYMKPFDIVHKNREISVKKNKTLILQSGGNKYSSFKSSKVSKINKILKRKSKKEKKIILGGYPSIDEMKEKALALKDAATLKADNLKKATKEKAAELKEKGSAKVDELKVKGSELKEQGSAKLDELKVKGSELKEQGSAKLDELKEKGSAKVDELKVKGEELKEKASAKVDELKEQGSAKLDELKVKGEELKEKGSAKVDELKEKGEELKEKGSAKVDELKEKGAAKLDELKEKGSDKLDELKEKGEELKEKGTAKLDELKEKGEELKEKGSDKLNELKEKGTAKLDELKEKGSDKLDELKEKGEELKEQGSAKLDELKEKAKELKEDNVSNEEINSENQGNFGLKFNTDEISINFKNNKFLDKIKNFDFNIFLNEKISIVDWMFFPLWSIENTPYLGVPFGLYLDFLSIVISQTDIFYKMLGTFFEALKGPALQMFMTIFTLGPLVTVGAFITPILSPVLAKMMDMYIHIVSNTANITNLFIQISRKNFGLAYIILCEILPLFEKIMNKLINLMIVINKLLARGNQVLDMYIYFLDNYAKTFLKMTSLNFSDIINKMNIFKAKATHITEISKKELKQLKERNDAKLEELKESMKSDKQ